MSDHDHIESDITDNLPSVREGRSMLLFAFVLLVPVIGALGIGFYEKHSDDGPFLAGASHPLTAAADKVEAYSRLFPPQGNWRAQGVRIIDDETLVLDVELPSPKHATVISTRRPRIQYSYIKLACPPDEAGHKPLMNEGDRVVVSLRFQGKMVAEGACPPS